MYLGKPSYLVAKTGACTKEETTTIQKAILEYRANCRDDYNETVEEQFHDGRSSGKGGHFSIVIDHPTDPEKIIKIQIVPTDYYPQFVNLVLKGLVRKYCPTFYTTGQALGHNFYIMERVDILGERDRTKDHHLNEIANDINACNSSTQYKQRQVNVRPFVRNTGTFAWLYIRRTIGKFLKEFNEDWFFDLHTHNWGTRKDGSLVCLDPIA